MKNLAIRFFANLFMAALIAMTLAIIAGTLTEFVAIKLSQPVPNNILTVFSSGFWQAVGYVPKF